MAVLINHKEMYTDKDMNKETGITTHKKIGQTDWPAQLNNRDIKQRERGVCNFSQIVL